MKRFIIISLLSAMTLPILACAWSDSHNYYLYCICSNEKFNERVEKICNDNWKAYLGSTEEYFWFRADDVIEAAKQKGDALMVSYVENLNKYLECVSTERQKLYEWNYPTKEELAQQQKDLQAVRTYALGKTKSKLRSQHALLYMRCNMMLGKHQENITFWQQTASQFIETVYKDMMKNIYAGALYKTGQEDEAGELFAEMGDYESLMTQYYKKRSYLAISQHYRLHPNSKVLPFMLEDFVCNTQEAIDALNGNYGGKLFIRDINKQEAWQMMQFCELVVREGKTETPIMWKAAKAWIEYLYGEEKDALKDINAAMKLEGTQRMKDNARELQIFITAAQAKPGEKFDNQLVEDLEWLESNRENTNGQTYRFLNRFTHQILTKHYADNPVRKAAILSAMNENWEAQECLDTMRVDFAEKYLFFINTPAKNTLDKWLKAHQSQENVQQQLEDLIGTKYMRLCQWDKAIKWLEHVPAKYYDEKSYRLYVILRKTDVEPWITRQWIKDSEVEKANQYNWAIRENPKLAFAKDMQMLKSTLYILKGKALEQRCYNLAIRYAQAHFRGDCWWLMRDGKSVSDTLRVNETDLAKKAIEMLQKTALSTDPKLKEKALFALGYNYFYNEGSLWRKLVWNDKTYESEWRVNKQSPQYRAFGALADFEKKNKVSLYVSKCDEYIQFRKQYH